MSLRKKEVSHLEVSFEIAKYIKKEKIVSKSNLSYHLNTFYRTNERNLSS